MAAFSCTSNSVPRTHIDDEYANASQIDPKILITTSRDPSAPLTQFAKVGINYPFLLCKFCIRYYRFWSSLEFYWQSCKQELKIVFPNAQRMNRGGQVSINFAYLIGFSINSSFLHLAISLNLEFLVIRAFSDIVVLRYVIVDT